MALSARFDLREPGSGPASASPLAAGARVDFCLPVPVGRALPDGEEVSLALAGSSLLIAGCVRSGVSCAAQHAAVAGALDPDCELWLFDPDVCGRQDWAVLRALAAVCVVERDARAAAVRERLWRLLERAGAQGARAGGVVQRLVVVANAEQLTADPEQGPAILEALVAIASAPPQAGLALVLTTHRPRELLVPALDRALRARLALREPDARAAAAVLGAGLAERHALSIAGLRHPGQGVLVADGAAQLVGGYHLSTPELKAACRAAAAGRVLDRAPHPA